MNQATTSESSKSKSKHGWGMKATSATITALTIAEKAVDGVPAPGLKAAVGGLLEVLKAARKTHQNKNDLKELDDHILDLADILNSIKNKDGAVGNEALQERTDKLAADLQNIVNSSGKIKSRNKLARFLANEEDAADIAGLSKSIDRAIQVFQVGANIALEKAVIDVTARVTEGVSRIERHLIDPKDPLNPLRPYVADAAFNSGSRTNVSRCFQDTRTELLQMISEWAGDPSGKPLFWLCGLAGTGKSTIAQTVAEQFSEKGQLGSSFFFSRDIASRSNPRLVFTTIAYQLARFNKSFFSVISDSVSGHPDSPAAYLRTQLEDLIIEPLRKLSDPDKPSVLVLVLDALDECSNELQVEEMLVLLASAIPKLPFRMKVFITSRPEVHIRSQFDNPAMRLVAQASFLHEIKADIIQRDVGLYINHHLQEISRNLLGGIDWPDKGDVKVMIEQSGGLFIYASAAIAYVGDKRYRQPKQRLRSLLEAKPAEGETLFKEMDKLYSYILQSALPPVGSRGFSHRLQKILGAIILLFDPLPAGALETLLSLEQDTVWSMLLPLHSVLAVSNDNTKAIRVFHKSFPDFMVDPQRCGNLQLLVEPAMHHRELALACLLCMNNNLHRDMCGIPWWTKNADVPNLPELLEKKVGYHLIYACHHWATHLQNISTGDTEVLESLNKFCSIKLLCWLEILSLSGRLPYAIQALEISQKWFADQNKQMHGHSKRVSMRQKAKHLAASLTRQKVSHHVDNNVLQDSIAVSEILHDCWRFTLRFFKVISLGAGQIYHSALLFTPDCLLYAKYKDNLAQ